MHLTSALDVRQDPPEPLSWLGGWAATLATGVCLGALVGGIGDAIEDTLRFKDDPAINTVMIALGKVIFYSPFVFVLAVVPITLCYALLRWIAPRVRMTWARRLGIGLMLGAAIQLPILRPDFSKHGSFTEFLQFPIPEILVTAVLLALVARASWFGLPRA